MLFLLHPKDIFRINNDLFFWFHPFKVMVAYNEYFFNFMLFQLSISFCNFLKETLASVGICKFLGFGNLTHTSLSSPVLFKVPKRSYPNSGKGGG